MDRDERLLALEKRLQAAEDHLEILNLLMTYGPLVDSATAEPAGALWVEGGAYNFGKPDGGTQRLTAPGEIAGMYAGRATSTWSTPAARTSPARRRSPSMATMPSRSAIRSWCCARRTAGSCGAPPVNHWSLRRVDEGWRIVERTNRTLNGSPESHEVMRKVAAI